MMVSPASRALEARERWAEAATSTERLAFRLILPRPAAFSMAEERLVTPSSSSGSSESTVKSSSREAGSPVTTIALVM